jgi:threonine dehydratase
VTTEHLDGSAGTDGLPAYISRESCDAAHRRIAPHIIQTPLEPSPELSRRLAAEVLLKLENLQVSGSFKLRGVVNKILSLPETDLTCPLVAASSGNHGAAFAHALEIFGLAGRLLSPRTISSAKLTWLRQSGIPLELVGDDCLEAELAARAHAAERHCVMISPYNDRDIVVGQATIGVELARDAAGFDAVLVPVGGGGLVSGIGAYLKAVAPRTAVIGCQPANSAVMYHSLQAGRIVEEESLPTLADGTAGGIEAGSITFDLCRKVVDEFVLLSEEEISAAMVLVRRHHGMDIEGAAALSVAAAVKLKGRFRGQRIALIISGGRVDPSLIDESEVRHE